MWSVRKYILAGTSSTILAGKDVLANKFEARTL
mgnify:CR=1 FL=1